MTLEATLPVLHRETFSAVDIPYGDSLFSMTVFLPNEGTTINDLILQINHKNWDEWTASLYEQDVQLFLPRFKLEYRESLVDVLAGLGMEIAFTGGADFYRINRSGGLFISDVIHKTFLEVNEEGTQAAAVTAVIITDSAGSEPAIFRVDKPFIFAIRENHSGTILFMGKITDMGNS